MIEVVRLMLIDYIVKKQWIGCLSKWIVLIDYDTLDLLILDRDL